jgi:DNA repair photolyase
MKHFLLIISLLFVTGLPLSAQEEEHEAGDKIRDKMNEYIQRRLDLSKDEAARFSPVFLEYFKEWRRTLRENKDDKLEMQRKIIDLRIRYRTRFREILGEQRGNQVFNHQEAFIREVRNLRQERLRNPGARPPLRRIQ